MAFRWLIIAAAGCGFAFTLSMIPKIFVKFVHEYNNMKQVAEGAQKELHILNSRLDEISKMAKIARLFTSLGGGDSTESSESFSRENESTIENTDADDVKESDLDEMDPLN